MGSRISRMLVAAMMVALPAYGGWNGVSVSGTATDVMTPAADVFVVTVQGTGASEYVTAPPASGTLAQTTIRDGFGLGNGCIAGVSASGTLLWNNTATCGTTNATPSSIFPTAGSSNLTVRVRHTDAAATAYGVAASAITASDFRYSASGGRTGTDWVAI